MSYNPVKAYQVRSTPAMPDPAKSWTSRPLPLPELSAKLPPAAVFEAVASPRSQHPHPTPQPPTALSSASVPQRMFHNLKHVLQVLVVQYIQYILCCWETVNRTS